jgi:hypothetical protein
MIGFTQYSPAVLALLIDRDKYKPLIITNVFQENLKKLAEFLECPDIRTKVIMFASVENLLAVVEEGFNLQTSKIIIMDTISSLFKITNNVKDVRKRGNSFQFVSIVPADLNAALDECCLGVEEIKITTDVPLEEISLKTKVIQRNLNTETELSSMIQEAIEHLGNKERGEASEGLLQFVVGILGKKKLGSLCRIYSIPSAAVEKLIAYVSSYKGKALRTAFMDINIYHTPSKIALQETKTNKLDFNYLTTYLPLDIKYEFVLNLPKSLLKKRGENSTLVKEQELKDIEKEDIEKEDIEKEELEEF